MSDLSPRLTVPQVAAMQAVPDLWTLRDVMGRLRGRVGRNNLLRHLAAVPRFGGGPTHRRNGRKILFTPADYARLIESLSGCRGSDLSAERVSPPTTCAEPSEKRMYMKARELLTPGLRKDTAQVVKGRFTKNAHSARSPMSRSPKPSPAT